jgi:hypothetical protein
MRDFVDAENFYAALRFDKPYGKTKKFPASAKGSNGCRASARGAGYVGRAVSASTLLSFLPPRRAVARRNAGRFAFLVVSAGRGDGEKIRRRIVPLAERKKGVVLRVILLSNKRGNGWKQRVDKVCVCPTAPPVRQPGSQTPLAGGLAPVHPHQVRRREVVR